MFKLSKAVVFVTVQLSPAAIVRFNDADATSAGEADAPGA